MAEQDRVETIYQLVGDLGTAISQVNNAVASIEQSLAQLLNAGVTVAPDPNIAALKAAVEGLVTAQAAEKAEVDVIDAEVTPPTSTSAPSLAP